MADTSLGLSMLALGIAQSGGGGEPTAYLKDASVNSNTLTITKKDDTTVTYTPTIPTYTAGSNVQITDGVISATDTTYTAGTGIDITNNVISGEIPTLTISLAQIISQNPLTAQFTNEQAAIIESKATNAVFFDLSALGLGNSYFIKNNDVNNIYMHAWYGASTGDNAKDSNIVYQKSTKQGILSECILQKKLTAGTNITINENNVISATGGGSSYTFTNGLTESSGTVSWDLNDRIQKGPSSSPYSLNIGNTSKNVSGSYSEGSIAIGRGVKTNGEWSVAIGNGGEKGFTPIIARSSALAFGKANFYVDHVLSAEGAGSIASGYVNSSGGKILTQGSGSRAGGYSTGGQIKACRNGSIAYGCVGSNSSSKIKAGEINDAQGSVAIGYAIGGGSISADGGNGACAIGCMDSSGYMGAFADGAFAQGIGAVARGVAQHAAGKWNVEDNNNTYAYIIGNGTSHAARSNALTVDWNGNLVCNNIPAPPSEDGEYDLHCSIVSGAITYSWVARS